MHQTETLSHAETINIITRFYEDCVRFWTKEKECCAHHYKEPIDITQMALCDIARLNRNPYVPNGQPLDKAAQQTWLDQHGYTAIHKGETT